MTDARNAARVAKWASCMLICAAPLALCIRVSANRADRVRLFPKLHAGQVLSYQISYHSDKQIRTQSSVIVASPPDNAKVDVRGLLRLEILRVEAPGQRSLVQARSRFEILNSDPHLKVPNVESPAPTLQRQDSQRQDPQAKFVDFMIFPDGRIDAVKGLDDLFPEQQQAWQEWASRFALAA